MEAQDVTRSASVEGRGRVFLYTKVPDGGVRMLQRLSSQMSKMLGRYVVSH